MIDRFQTLTATPVGLPAVIDPRSSTVRPEPAGTTNGRVLVVDDEPQVLRALSRVLRTQGFIVDEAKSGVTALSLLNENSFDLVLSDISMPGMDGLQLLRAVRARDPDLPVVLMTAVPAIETAALAVEFGALRYLTKPLDFGILTDAVQFGIRLRKMALLKREAAVHARFAEDSAGARADLEARFTRGLGSVWMAYQAIISWSRKTVFAYEALVRSDEPTMHPPGVFFETAARLDRLPELGRKIRSNVAAALGNFPGQALFFVNLHPRDLLDDELYQLERPLVRQAARVVLEITERASLESIPDIRGRVGKLREAGFRIAIDDLGAGYSGLSSLVQLQPDIVKFDVALVRNVDSEPTKQRIIESMTKLCRDMGVLAVAEGVETQSERDMLVDLGCDLMQGFLFARPGRSFAEPSWAE